MTHLVSALRWYMLDQLGLVGLGMYSALGVVEVGVGLSCQNSPVQNVFIFFRYPGLGQ